MQKKCSPSQFPETRLLFFGLIQAVSIISFTGYNIIWYACGERKFFFPSDLVAVSASLEGFTFRLLGLCHLDDSAIFIFLSIFQKILKNLKMLFQKIKPVISSCFLYIKKKIIKYIYFFSFKFLFSFSNNCTTLINTK